MTRSLMTKLGIDTSDMQAGMAQAGKLGQTEMDRIRRAVDYATKTLRDMERASREAAGAVNMKRAADEVAGVGRAAQASAAQTASAMRMLPAQATDVVTQLAGGANPMLVLLQQGGQVKDMFGGFGPMFSGLAAAITPTVLAVGAGAAVVGTLGFALYEAAQQDKAFRNTIALTNNAAGLTASSLLRYSESVAEASRQTVSGAREIVMALAATGQVGPAAMTAMATAAARVSEVSGTSAAKVAEDFAQMAGGVAKWAAEHNKAWNFINVEQYRYIRGLEEQGKAEEAMRFVSQRVTAQLEDQARNLGHIERALLAGSKAWDDFWQAALAVGREETTREKLDAAITRLRQLRNSIGPSAAGIERAEQAVQMLKEQLKLEQQQADVRARNAAANRKAIEDEREAEKKRRGGAEKQPRESGMFVGPPEFKDSYPFPDIAGIKRSQRDNQDAARQFRQSEIEAYEQVNAEIRRRQEQDRAAAEQAAQQEATKRVKEGVQRVKQVEDAIINLAKGGKNAFRDLWSFMAEEYLRNIARIQLQRVMLDGAGAFVGWGGALSNLAGMFGITLAGGKDFVPYDGYPAILHQGERVQSAVEARKAREGAGAGLVVDNSGQVWNIGQGVSRAEVYAAVRQGNLASEARMRRLMREGVLS